MKTWLYLLILTVVGLIEARAAESEKLNYSVQLIRGSNGTKPPVLEAKPIGAKLSKKLRPVFNWQSYWEMNRQHVELARGQKAKVRLSKEREVEIDLTRRDKRTVTAYEGGRALSRITRPVGGGMTITGGDRDSKTVWFIVVRRDKPAN